VASQCIPAFSQEDFVLCVVVAAKADPLKASTRLKVRIEANAFMMSFLLRCRYIKASHNKSALLRCSNATDVARGSE
jgi:hypothetical protein